MSQARLKLCLVSPPPPVAQALEALGHDILVLRPPHGTVAPLPELLEEHSFTPDLLIQTEVLAERILLSGLEELDCPKAFWAVDPHLNAYWQAPYGRLFDLVFSTQKRWLTEVGKKGAPVRWLPWYGPDAEWRPWSRRDLDMSFVGRISASRPTRKRFVDTLKARFGDHFTHAQDLNQQQMFALYGRSRIVPNESIMGEINFRLFEGTGHGCLVVGQPLDGQDELFEPGRETAVYHDCLDLVRRCDTLLHDPGVMAVARAGYERVRAEHLPEHRARTLLDELQAAPGCAARGPNGAKWLALALAELWRAGRKPGHSSGLSQQLAPFALDRHVLPCLCRLLAENNQPEGLRDLLQRVLAENIFSDDTEVNAGCGLSALSAGMADLEQRFRERQCGHGPPMDARDCFLLWSDELRRAEVAHRSGFVIVEALHVPASTWECLAKALSAHPGDLEIIRRMDELLTDIPGSEPTRAGLLSHLSLHEPDDYRHALHAGLVNLRSCNTRAGLEELVLARTLADKAGLTDAFLADLRAQDSSGLLSAALQQA